MKTAIRFLLIGIIATVAANKGKAQDELNGVTFGFSAGYSVLNHKPGDYFLTPDSNFLQSQALSKGGFVISSVVSVKLGKLAVASVTRGSHKVSMLVTQDDQDKPAPWSSRFSINAALDLLNVRSDNVSFNTRVNGGLGIGYFLTDNVQVAAFYDIQTIRQVRDYITSKYLGKRIPNGSEYYNALDQNDNTIFYNKTFTGFSFKIIFSLANKKPVSEQ